MRNLCKFVNLKQLKHEDQPAVQERRPGRFARELGQGCPRFSPLSHRRVCRFRAQLFSEREDDAVPGRTSCFLHLSDRIPLHGSGIPEPSTNGQRRFRAQHVAVHSCAFPAFGRLYQRHEAPSGLLRERPAGQYPPYRLPELLAQGMGHALDDYPHCSLGLPLHHPRHHQIPFLRHDPVHPGRESRAHGLRSHTPQPHDDARSQI